MSVSDTIEAEGHLIDSGLLSAIFDKIIEVKGSYEILTFDIGRTNDDASRIEMRVTRPMTRRCSTICSSSSRRSGAHPVRERNALVKPAEKDRCVPDDFYSTTNHRTHVRLERALGRGRQAAHGRGHRRRRRIGRLPQAARREGRRASRLRSRRHPRDARVPANATASASRS